MTENEARMMYVRKELAVNSGGPGLNRGGLGQVVEYEILGGGPADKPQVESSVRLSGRKESSSFPVSGRGNGKAGRGYGLEINGVEVDHGISRTLQPGDRVRLVLSGGGGYGDPFERDAGRVLNDVREGYVTIEAAKIDYGVVVDPETLLVNATASEIVRQPRQTEESA